MTELIIRSLFLTMLVIINKVTAQCPEMCHQIACGTGVLSCPEGGLDQLPVLLPPGTSKILLTNHLLSNPFLRPSNLSLYGPPQFKVVKIAIQSCGLRGIVARAFSHLTALTTLDLANNKIVEVLPDTFSSLSLNFLRLDGNKGIMVHSHAFRGLSLVTLSLINCSLTVIPFEAIHEISGSLRKLYLTNNRIQTIERVFKDIFEQLVVLQINENPINCTCDLQWLSAVLTWRRRRRDRNEETPGVVNEAQCQGPLAHRNKLITSLTTRDFNCHLPKLRLIDVHMTSNSSAILTCSSEQEYGDSPSVQWLSMAQTLNPMFSSSARGISLVSVKSHSNVDQFLCLVTNENGNVTVIVKIQWPNRWSNWSNLNIVIPSTRPPGDVNTSFVYSKRFTLLEMMGGVVGTFTLTMLFFMCIYRHMVRSLRRRHHKKTWYVGYEPAAGSDSQTYDVPHCTLGSYNYSGHIFNNLSSPLTYGGVNGIHAFSTLKAAAAL